MCALLTQRTPLIDFLYFATGDLPCSNRIWLTTLSYKQTKELETTVSITSSSEILGVPLVLYLKLVKTPAPQGCHNPQLRTSARIQ